MDDNSLKNNGINPALWPVLSLQSRAAARLFLNQKATQLSPRVSPVLAYYHRRSQASKEFFLLHDCEPVAGDLLRYDEIQATTGVDFCDWAVYIERDTLPLGEGQEVERNGYRLKVQGGRIYRTLRTEEQKNFERGCYPSLWSPSQGSEWWESPGSNPVIRFRTGSEWWVFPNSIPEGRWRKVEADALGIECGRHHPAQIPTIPAVTFLGVIDGKHRCRPATDAEITAPPEVKG